MAQQQKSAFRIRGIEQTDGTVQLVFGNESVDPSLKVIFDQWVVESVEKEPYAGQDQNKP